MKKILSIVLGLCFFTSVSFGSASVPVIVGSVVATTSGNTTIYTPTADGNYRASVYIESGGGSPFICAFVAFANDFNSNISSPTVCSDGTSQGQFVYTFHAKSGTAIVLSAGSFPGAGGSIFAVVEQL